MPRIAFVLSNDRHHAAMFLPVAAAVAARPGFECRALSLCEFRGLRSPVEEFGRAGIAMRRAVPFSFRSPGAGAGGAGGPPSRRRRLAQGAAWAALLRRPVGALLAERPDLVVLPNDAAYPYDRIAALLRRRGVPFLLVQEGVRFPLPASAGGPVYGGGGAAAVAAWGEASAEYFRAAGVPPERIHLTGNPRFDVIAATDWRAPAAAARERFGLAEETLLLISNPIDDQGFCSHDEKLRLLRALVEGLLPLFARPGFSLAISLHARESAEETGAALAGLPGAERVAVLDKVPLYPLLAASAAAVILASTVGLEALLFGLPLGVVAIPGVGFVHDYVAGGGALGLACDATLPSLAADLLALRGRPRPAAEVYLRRHLAVTTGATERLADLVTRLVR